MVSNIITASSIQDELFNLLFTDLELQTYSVDNFGSGITFQKGFDVDDLPSLDNGRIPAIIFSSVTRETIREGSRRIDYIIQIAYIIDSENLVGIEPITTISATDSANGVYKLNGFDAVLKFKEKTEERIKELKCNSSLLRQSKIVYDSEQDKESYFPLSLMVSLITFEVNQPSY